MEKTALISIALCTYNGASFLEEQIMSILNQTHKNIELVIVDDCSTDNTFQISENLAFLYPQIKSFRNTHNLGFNKNFEKAIELTTGEYVAISDQDDIWLPSKLEVLLDNIKDKWLVFSNSKLIDEEDKELGKQILKPDFTLEGKSYKSFLFYNSVTGHTSMFNKSFVTYFTPIPPEGYYDWWMGFIAMYHNQAICVNQCLTLHRIHQKSVTFNAYKQQTKKVLNDEINTNLRLVQTYKGLTTDDKILINKIAKAYQKKISLFLINLIIKHYNEYFPDRKPRKWFSKLNFAIKLK
ncbi:glycosyltransferase family 2 protein [Pedobacter changchengzhani]|uniref:Glycosyltransferase family 2 protein n=1 Tax=Pedobacter changchengzhani TaxID=2529274 RepID=A0A4R5MMV7_9SPHI|nr:glycosyltransferase family 2 protein [Pedobacter changchengzhani]TDG37147.1 glycosyltransferase family 2 protein [Pedobacter changchengzhani]